MSSQPPRLPHNLSIKVRQAYSWSKADLARRTLIHDKTVRRREAWDGERGCWRQELTGEALTLYRLMLACDQLGLDWLVEQVTRDAFALDERGQESEMKDQRVAHEALRSVAETMKSLVKQLERLPKANDFLRANTVQRLRESILSLEQELKSEA